MNSKQTLELATKYAQELVETSKRQDKTFKFNQSVFNVDVRNFLELAAYIDNKDKLEIKGWLMSDDICKRFFTEYTGLELPVDLREMFAFVTQYCDNKD